MTVLLDTNVLVRFLTGDMDPRYRNLGKFFSSARDSSTSGRSVARMAPMLSRLRMRRLSSMCWSSSRTNPRPRLLAYTARVARTIASGSSRRAGEAAGRGG